MAFRRVAEKSSRGFKVGLVVGFLLTGSLGQAWAQVPGAGDPLTTTAFNIIFEKAGAAQALTVPAWDWSQQVWLPLQPACACLGGSAAWIARKGKVSIKGPAGHSVVLTLNYPKLVVDGRLLARLPQAPRLWQGQVVVTPAALLSLWNAVGGRSWHYFPESRTFRQGAHTEPTAPAASAAPAEPTALAEPTASAEPAAPDSKPRPAMSASLPLELVVIDAGHGGHDPGAIGPTKLLEKNVTLDIARQVAGEVEKKLGCKVVLTRNADVFIPLAERAEIANRLKADLFVSIHANAAYDRAAKGSEVFIYNRAASSRKAAETARSENRDANYLEMIKDDLRQSVHEADSIMAAGLVGQELEKTGLGARGLERAPFYVLAKSHMPSILVETAFISNHEEERKLRDPEFCSRIAAGVVRGLQQYAREKKPLPAAR